MPKLNDILTDLRQGSTDVDAAEITIKEIFSALLEEASIGISNVDATELYGEMSRGIENA